MAGVSVFQVVEWLRVYRLLGFRLSNLGRAWASDVPSALSACFYRSIAGVSV